MHLTMNFIFALVILVLIEISNAKPLTTAKPIKPPKASIAMQSNNFKIYEILWNYHLPILIFKDKKMFGGDMKIKYKSDTTKALAQIDRPLWPNRTVYVELIQNVFSRFITKISKRD